MTELTLEKINIFLQTLPTSGKTSGNCSDTLIDNYNITDIDTFLMNKISTLDSSSTRKDNFLTLYNDQYFRNLEIGVGILCIGAVLAKMMFYPTII
jgi:hypothetical protein